MARQIVVEIVGDASKFNSATSGAITKAEGLGGSLKNIGKGIAVGAGVAAFGLLTGAMDIAIGTLGAMDQAFKDDEVSQTKLAQALKNNIPNWSGSTKAVEEYASAQGKLGFTDDEVRDSLGQLIGITHDLTKAQELNTLAQELARAKGIDLATASDIVTKAAQGNGKALKGLGIDIKGATDAAGMLDAIQQNVKGSAEAWAATNEGKLAVSNVKVGEAMEKIGGVIDKVAQVVLPALADAFSFVADVVAQAMPFVEGAIKALGPVFKAVGAIAGVVFKGIGVAIGVVAGVIRVQVAIISGILNALRVIFTVVGNFVKMIWDGVIGVIKGAINGVIGIINGVIGAINGIQVHIHVGPVNLDWNGLKIPRIPKLHAGGIVPGTPGAEVLTLLQAGERVLPRNRAGGAQEIHIHIDQGAYIDGPSIDLLTNKIAARLRVAPGS